MQCLLQMCCTEFGTTVDAVLSNRRYRNLIEAKQAFVYLADKHIGPTLTAMAKLLNRADHSTIYHSRESAMVLFKHNKTFREKVQQVEKNFVPWAMEVTSGTSKEFLKKERIDFENALGDLLSNPKIPLTQATLFLQQLNNAYK